MCTYFRKLFLLLLTVMVISACERRTTGYRSEMQSDTLISFIEKRIEEKKRYEEFRRNTLPRDFEKKVENYYPVIRKYSKRYGFDWRLIVMQILKESRFREDARSQMGAMGLMQIMPSTAMEIRREMDIEYIANNPRENIAAGIYHLYKQVLKFPDAGRENRVKLALGAYNSGIGRIYDAQSIARYLNLDPYSWEAVKECLPMLTAKHWQLHLEIWELGVPNYGYFYGYKETVNYVDDIIEGYDIFTSIHQDI